MTRDDPARFAALLIRLSAIRPDHFHKGALQVYLAVRPCISKNFLINIKDRVDISIPLC